MNGVMGYRRKDVLLRQDVKIIYMETDYSMKLEIHLLRNLRLKEKAKEEQVIILSHMWAM